MNEDAPRDLWRDYLDAFANRAERAAALAWYESRPLAVRALMRRYPPGVAVQVGGRPAYVVGYRDDEDGPAGLYLSRADPLLYYEAACADSFFVCGEHAPTVLPGGFGPCKRPTAGRSRRNDGLGGE